MTIVSLPCFPKEHLKHDRSIDATRTVEETLIQRGKDYVDLTQRRFVEYDGDAFEEGNTRRKVSQTLNVQKILA